MKIEFHWHRHGSKNQNSSLWVRVSEAWAGNQMGAVFTPRIGQEVLVDFENSDPDRPVIIGKVNNSQNLPPWRLTENQALSGFRSRELGEGQAGNSASGRSNHLIFDDSEGHIQSQLKSDHAHSSISLGDIYRVHTNKGRMEGRGRGFELRSDDWGSVRGGKGLYISTYEREKARSTTMDADEAVKLIDQAQDLGRLLSDRARSHRAESLKGINHLNNFISQTLSIKKNSVEAAKGISGDTPIDKKPSNVEAPTGFSEACMVMASPKGIAITTPEEIYSYAQRDTVIVSGQNFNLATGKSLQASVGETFSMFVQDDAKFFAGKGKIQVQAHNNNIEIVADKTLKVISNEDKVEIAADKEILIACGGAYIRLKGGNIEIHAPGKVEIRGQPELLSPTSMRPTLFSFPEQKPLEPYVQQFVLLDQERKKPVQNVLYQVTDMEGNVVAEGRTNEKGETQLVDSEYIPQTFILTPKEEDPV